MRHWATASLTKAFAKHQGSALTHTDESRTRAISIATVEHELENLIAGSLEPKQFSHREHVRLGFEMLRRYDFPEAAFLFSRGLRGLAARAGRPEAYHETITIAFLALIGERRALIPEAGWDLFITINSDLLDKHCLQRWYVRSRLAADLARKTFVMPLPTIPRVIGS